MSFFIKRDSNSYVITTTNNSSLKEIVDFLRFHSTIDYKECKFENSTITQGYYEVVNYEIIPTKYMKNLMDSGNVKINEVKPNKVSDNEKN